MRSLLSTCGHKVPWVDSYLGKLQIEHRHLPTTTRCETAELAFYHPAMQEMLLQAASDAGAQVVRGAVAREISNAATPTVSLILDGDTKLVEARIVVGADGRLSSTRRLVQLVLWPIGNAKVAIRQFATGLGNRIGLIANRDRRSTRIEGCDHCPTPPKFLTQVGIHVFHLCQHTTSRGTVIGWILLASCWIGCGRR